MEALGIDPNNTTLCANSTVSTNCSFGAVIQQLYTSGPSGWAHFAGDYLFEEGGISRKPEVFRYPVKVATAMELSVSKRGSATSQRYTVATTMVEQSTQSETKEEETSSLLRRKSTAATSLFDRKLRVYSESTFGRVLLVDENEPGKFAKNVTSSMMEYTVHDALSFLSMLDIKPLLGNDKKLRIT